MISDELQELAALHALEMLRGDEAAAFEKQCAENAELAALVQSLRDSADGLAFALPPLAPPLRVRQRILGEKMELPPTNVVPFPDKPRSWSVLKVAAIAAIIPSGLAWYYYDQGEQTEMTYTMAAKEANRREKGFMENITELQTVKENLQTRLDGAHTENNATREARDKAIAEITKLRADLTMLQSDKDKLMAEMAALQARGLFDQARIALMASTSKPATKATAVSLWDQQAQGGVIVVQNLPPLPADRNYQLWVLDDGQPVSAGLLTLDGKGGGRIEFKARKPIAKPTVFAVTNETRGEKDAPDMDRMVLAGQ